MKLTEKQAFNVIEKILDWIETNHTISDYVEITKEEISDFVMLDLINIDI